MEIKTVYLEGYGCAANQNNSEILQGILERKGLIFVSKPGLADIVILNTCIVKGPTMQRMVSRIKELAKKNLMIVAGCMPEVQSKRILNLAKKENPKVKISLLGTNHFHDISKVVKKLGEGKETVLVSKKREIKLCLLKTSRRKGIGITQISEGCQGDCSYCFVKFAKGKLFSYPQEKILKNIQQDIVACKEIWITSQDSADYGLDKGKYLLPELLRKVVALPGNFQIRIGMMNPSSLLPILDDIIEIYKNKKIKKFLHVPVQSGSDKILELMNRKYKVRDFYEIINKFREKIPNIVISTDIIVGFPHEDEEDFEKTLELVRKIKPEVLNISKFWPMPGAAASEMEQVSLKEQKKRAIKLMKLHHKIKKLK